MAKANKFPQLSPSPDEVHLYMQFALDAANAPTFVGNSAWASNFVSIARSSAGKYLITLRDTFLALKGCYPMVKAAAAVDLVAQHRADDVSGAKTVTVALMTGAVETDPPAVGANACFLSVHLCLQGSTAKAG